MDILNINRVSQLIKQSLSGERSWVVALHNLDIGVEELIAYLPQFDAAVHERLAEHQNAAPQLLKVLSDSPHSHVRAAVTENANTEFDVLRKLASDHSVDVRFRLAENPHIGETLLTILLEDENAHVA